MPQQIIDFATAAATLKHTVYGDVNLFTEKIYYHLLLVIQAGLYAKSRLFFRLNKYEITYSAPYAVTIY